MRAFAKYKLTQWSALLLSVLLAFEPVVYAQYEGPATPPPTNVSTQTQPAFSQQELDQMLAPIALYPDQLLSQILMAATYPLEVVEAARWSRANPDLSGDDAVRAVQLIDWDPSVKSLVAFPQILRMMDDKLDWTERLGDAFLAQEQQVMDTVQYLRQKAYDVGNLRSNDQMQVDTEGQTIIVEPATPDIIYVPYYDPTVVYGPWWWPAYPPVYWAPWPGYYVSSGFAWGIGITIATGFFFGDFDWDHHRVNVVNVNNYYYNRHEHDERNRSRFANDVPAAWQHDPVHRRGVPYREDYLRQHYGNTRLSPQQRQDFRGYDQFPSSEGGEFGNRLNEGNGATAVLPSRPRGSFGRSAETPPNAGGGLTNQSVEHGFGESPSVPRTVGRPTSEASPPALEGIGRGSEVRNYSSRGRASYEGAVHNQHTNPEPIRSGNVSIPRSSDRNSESRPSGNAPGSDRNRHSGN